jgi:hypothetical protein
MVSDIDEILLGRVSQSKANKFIQLAGSFIWNLRQIEENNSNLLKEVLQALKDYSNFLKSEYSTNSLASKIKMLENEFKKVQTNRSF